MELTLFIIIGAVAVVAAAMMLISENAVHSAIFLILNFACIAFFFLLLNAPFLAMVQITVYAGAIMVLFLFVIMLLGAERLLPEKQPRFRWLAPAAVILALVFLITTGIAIIQGEIDLSEPADAKPVARVIHALDGIEAIDVYMDDAPVAQSLRFGDSTDFQVWGRGRYSAALFAAGSDPANDTPLVQQMVDLKAGEALSLVAVGTPEAPRLVAASQDVSSVEDKDTLRVMAVNALPDRPAIDVLDASNPDEKSVVIGNIAFGEASSGVILEEGTYTIGAYPAGDEKTRLFTLEDEELTSNTAVLWVFTNQRRPDNSWVNLAITLHTDAEASFGSPTQIGQTLFSRYVLPLEMVALVLLVAMIGAIILTHETLAPRRQTVRRLANPPAGLEQPITGTVDES